MDHPPLDRVDENSSTDDSRNLRRAATHARGLFLGAHDRRHLLLVLTACAILFQIRPFDSLRGVAARQEIDAAAGKSGGRGLDAIKAARKNVGWKKQTTTHDGAEGDGEEKTKARAKKEGGFERKLTNHTQNMQRTLVDLHSADLEENQDLDLGNEDVDAVAKKVMGRIGSNLEQRLAKLFSKAKTPECRAKIGEHFGHFINAIGTEDHQPFANIKFENTCTDVKYDFDDLPQNITIGDIQLRTYQPPQEEADYIDDPDDLRLCFGILTHNNPNATIRLIETLHEDGHVFVVHVDAKESSDDTHANLVQYAADHPHVHVLAHPHRVRVNWGGFSMVNATLSLLRYAFATDYPRRSPLDFHKFVHIASTSYPLASNTAIRRKIASYPLDANMFNVVFKPTNPAVEAWHYFVECDDAVHRIYRLPPLSEGKSGVDLYTASQWFIASREFARYIAQAPPGSFVQEFLEYVEHVVVADEAFFGTVLRNTPFCHKHHNDNFLHVQFDRWENEVDEVERDQRKCLMPSPDHCGRSPTTMSLDYLPVLELSGNLFARKFLDEVDSQIKDVIDLKRAKEEREFREVEGGEKNLTSKVATDFEGHGVLIVARETVGDDTPLCLGLGESKNKVRLVPCFYEWVPQTLAPGWETGAVIEEETLMHNRWELGPCSSDGSLERLENGEMKMTPGAYSPMGPRCMLKQMDGLRAGRCLDGESERVQPGGEVQVFPCVKRWNQFVSFGNGTLAPKGSIHTTIPSHVTERIESTGREQEALLCVGVTGRGDMDEEPWEEDLEEGDEESDDEAEEDAIDEAAARVDTVETSEEPETDEDGAGVLLPMSNWQGEQVVTTRCSNVDAVIEWLFIPFIVEVDDTSQSNQTTAETSDSAEEEEL